jgi:hypothetical protein
MEPENIANSWGCRVLLYSELFDPGFARIGQPFDEAYLSNKLDGRRIQNLKKSLDLGDADSVFVQRYQ